MIKALTIIALICWILTGVGIFYHYVIIEKYIVRFGGAQGILTHNNLTGKEWLCIAYGCVESEISKHKSLTLSNKASDHSVPSPENEEGFHPLNQEKKGFIPLEEINK